MIGRKLFLLRKNPTIFEDRILVEYPNLNELRHIVIKKSSEYGYIILVEIIRFSIRTSKALRHHYKTTKKRVHKIINKRHVQKEESTPKDVSSFLKKVSEYKRKIKKIKNQVIEEEKENS